MKPTDSPGEDMAKALLLYRRIDTDESNKVNLNLDRFRPWPARI